MAAGQTFVDLRAVSVGCKVPYSTLARWAQKRNWISVKCGKRKLYRWDDVIAAVAERAT